MRFEHFDDEQKFIDSGVAKIVAACADKEGAAFVGISGGKTPLPMYQALSKNVKFNFEQTQFFLVDERYVPYDHHDSNYAAIKKSFAAALPVFFQNLHDFDTSLPLEESASRYAEDILKIPETRLDIAILGMGSDGHTASLFPLSPALAVEDKLVIATINETSPHPPVRERLTMTFPMLLKSREIILFVSGHNKQGALDDLLAGKKDVAHFPVRRLMDHTEFTIMYLAK